MAFTIYLQNKIMNHTFRNVAYTAPTSVYAALFTTATDSSGGGTEVTGGSYARQAITFGASALGAITNTSDIIFPTATASWGTVSYFAVMDQSGNMLAQGPLDTPKLVALGEPYTIIAGAINLSQA